MNLLAVETMSVALGTTSIPNRHLTGGYFRFHPGSIVPKNDNRQETGRNRRSTGSWVLKPSLTYNAINYSPKKFLSQTGHISA